MRDFVHPVAAMLGMVWGAGPTQIMTGAESLVSWELKTRPFRSGVLIARK